MSLVVLTLALSFMFGPALLTLAGPQGSQVSGSNPPPGSSIVQKTLLDLEGEWARALERGDMKALDRIVASDFVDTNYLGGIATKAQMFSAGASQDRPRRLNHLEEMRARVYGDTGIVNGLNLVTDQEGRFLRRVRFTDVFTRQNGRWRAVSAQETVVIAP
jgi:ketosteroid isomerase-like protein